MLLYWFCLVLNRNNLLSKTPNILVESFKQKNPPDMLSNRRGSIKYHYGGEIMRRSIHNMNTENVIARIKDRARHRRGDTRTLSMGIPK